MFEIKLFICIFFILHSFSRENTKCSSLCLVQQQKVTAIFLKKNWNMLSLTESAIFQEFVNSGLKGMAYRLIHQSEYWPLLMWTIWKTITFNLSNSFLAFLWHFHNKKYFFLKMSPSQTIVWSPLRIGCLGDPKDRATLGLRYFCILTPCYLTCILRLVLSQYWSSNSKRYYKFRSPAVGMGCC